VSRRTELPEFRRSSMMCMSTTCNSYSDRYICMK
jgi:hypothetical protein